MDKTQLFRRGVMTPDDPSDWTYNQWLKGRQKRLEKYYSQPQIRFIYKLQKAWEQYPWKTTFDDLYEMLKPTVLREADWNGRKWTNKRLSYHDFESVLWETTWKVIDDIYGYETSEDEFTLFETLKLYYKSRCLDVVRKATRTKQGKLEHEALTLQDWDGESVDIANEVTDRIFIKEMIIDPVLTDEERKFLRILYADPDASLSDLARQMGYNHHEQIKRLKARITRKLQAYNPYPKNAQPKPSILLNDTVAPTAELTLEEEDKIREEEMLMELDHNMTLPHAV